MSGWGKKSLKVLDEDQYVECLEKIIERDFFPDYERLKDQKEYLDAQENKNFEKMRQLALKYSTRNNSSSSSSSLLTPVTSGKFPHPSPATFETPIKTPLNSEDTEDNESLRLGYKQQRSTDVEKEAVRSKDRDLPLDKFLGKYTSEDCESFKTILDKTDEDQRVKNAWLYEAEERHQRMCRDMMMLEQSKEAEGILPITDGTKQTADNKLQVSAPTIPLNTWEYKAKNPLMYYPQGNYRSKDDHLFKKPKIIEHTNTRFSGNPFQDVAANRDKAAQAVLENRQLCGERVGHDGKSILPHHSPQVNGFSFVSDSPSPMPGVADSPLMTWGEVGSTPSRLDSPGPAFRFPEESMRDKLAHQMVDDVMKKKKAKKEKAQMQLKASFGTPQYRRSLATSERINSFSPAVQKLFGKRLTRGSDRALKASYTPSPRVSSTFSTPSNTPTSRRSTTPTIAQNITDNLLNLPQSSEQDDRKRAADFF